MNKSNKTFYWNDIMSQADTLSMSETDKLINSYLDSINQGQEGVFTPDEIIEASKDTNYQFIPTLTPKETIDTGNIILPSTNDSYSDNLNQNFTMNNSTGEILLIATIVIRTAGAIYCSNKAKKLNRSTLGWGTFGMVSPIIACIWIQFVKPIINFEKAQ